RRRYRSDEYVRCYLGVGQPIGSRRVHRDSASLLERSPRSANSAGQKRLQLPRCHRCLPSVRVDERFPAGGGVHPGTEGKNSREVEESDRRLTIALLFTPKRVAAGGRLPSFFFDGKHRGSQGAIPQLRSTESARRNPSAAKTMVSASDLTSINSAWRGH